MNHFDYSSGSNLSSLLLFINIMTGNNGADNRVDQIMLHIKMKDDIHNRVSVHNNCDVQLNYNDNNDN